MEKRWKCKCCGNLYHWSHAFSKFGYDDGDGNVETHLVARALESAGYQVKYGRWSPHNTIIYSIKKDNMEYMPVTDPEIRIGYDNPALYLPEDIRAVLESKIPSSGIFPY